MAIRFCLVLATALGALVAPAQAAFPGGNGQIVFHRTNDAGSSDLFVADPDGSNPVNLTQTPDLAYNDFEAAWSADGTRLAFVSASGIWTMDGDGSFAGPLTLGYAPSWSADGSKIYYERPEIFYPSQGKFEIYGMNADGTGQVSLTRDFGGEDPVASPRGDRIAFAHGSGRIHTMNLDGTDIRPVSSQDAFHPEWSPDGSQIVYARWRCCGTPVDLWIVNADGSGERRLTDTPGAELSAVFSPDGEHILFQRPGDPVGDEVWIMNADGSGERRLIEDARQPDWQPLPNRAPACSGVTAAPGQIAKHNRTFVTVALSGASDPDGDPVSISIAGVTQDEPLTNGVDARAGATPDSVRLRAERDNRGDGRVYRIAFEATDANGGSCTGTATVGVPRRNHAPAVDSAPPSFDSFGP